MKMRVRGLTLGGCHLGGGASCGGVLILALILNTKFWYHTGMFVGIFYANLC